MKIDCSSCAMYQSHHCDDCMVTALLHPPQDVVDISEDLSPPLDALVSAGLIPVLRFRPRDSAANDAAPNDAASKDAMPAIEEGPIADAG